MKFPTSENHHRIKIEKKLIEIHHQRPIGKALLNQAESVLCIVQLLWFDFRKHPISYRLNRKSPSAKDYITDRLIVQELMQEKKNLKSNVSFLSFLFFFPYQNLSAVLHRKFPGTAFRK